MSSSSNSSVGRNSLIMAAGTAASRVTGQIRTILLAAALGTTGIAANAYQAGSMIPQAVFTLISGGIFNAVLVPQIVRTLKEKDAEERLNKLITLAIALLLAVTALMTIATPLLTRMYVNGGSDMIALANAFTLWCMPQIFFYGLYTVLGQILAAKNRFGMYAWSSVGANVISCIGFTVFVLLFGKANEQPLDFWTPGRTALIAGSWTLGVAFQALILFLPLMRCGIHYRPKWGIAGIGLRTMGSVAGWSICIVVLDQLVNIVATRITTSAPAQAAQQFGMSQYEVAGNATYQNAFTLYVLPYSLIAVSVATALFPRISQAIGDHDIDGARLMLSDSLRNVGVMMVFFTVAFIVMPVPIILALLPSVSVTEALLIAAPLMTQGIGLPLSSAYLIIQRTFYAFEDGKSPFLFMLLFNVFYVVIVVGASFVLSPLYWVTMLGIASTIGHLLAFPFLINPLRKRFDGHLDGRRITVSYLKAVLAGVAAVVCGLALQQPVYRLIGARIGATDGSMNWLQAVLACIMLTLVITVVYIGVLWLLRSQELTSTVHSVAARLGLNRSARHEAQHKVASAGDAASGTADTADTTSGTTDIAADAIPDVAGVLVSAADTTATTDANPADIEPVRETSFSTIPADRISQENGPFEITAYGVETSMKPQLGDTLVNRYTLVAPLRNEAGLEAWKVSDRVLTRDCQLFIIKDKRVLEQVTDAASALATIKDNRFTPVLQIQHHGDAAIIVTQLDAGLSLTHYLHASTKRILSFDAIRSIMGETTDAVRKLLSRGLTHQAVTTDTVRISIDGVQLADTPLSPMLVDASQDADNMPAELLAVRQLSALLYDLLTRTPYQADTVFDLSRISNDAPSEFTLICRRGLGLQAKDSGILPMSSLAELDALLGDWTPLNQLHDRDIALPGISGDASISSVPLRQTDESDIAAIPSDIINSNPMPALTLNIPKYSTALDSDSVVDVTPMTGDLFSAFDGSKSPSSDKTTLSLDVSDVRNNFSFSTEAKPIPEIDFSDAQTADAAGLPLDPIGPVMAPITPENTALTSMPAADPSMEQTQIIAPVNAPVPDEKEIPAFSSPAVQSAQANLNDAIESDVADQKLVAGLPTKIIAVIVGIIVLVAAGVIAVSSLRINSEANIDGTSNTSDPWNADLDNVPFGDSNGAAVTGGNDSESDNTGNSSGQQSNSSEQNSNNGSDSTASKDTSKSKDTAKKDSDKNNSGKKTDDAVQTKDKEAKAIPEPKYENNTALTIASQEFVTDPGGQRGYAYHLHLDQSRDTYRMTIGITTSGGHGYIYADTTGDPTQGKQVADFAFAEGGTTEVKFNKVTKTQDLVLWVPADSMPQNQLYIQKIQVF